MPCRGRRLKSGGASADKARMTVRRIRWLPAVATLAAGLWLSGCDQLGIETVDAIKARKEADSKAVGAACRQAGRAIEDCYNLNTKAETAAVFAGWREMDEYMRENNLAVVEPKVPPPALNPPKPASAPDEAHGEDAAEDEHVADAAHDRKKSKAH